MGAFAVKSFEDINTAQDQLIGKTNVTGAAAQQMRQSFNNVFGNTPESASDVVSAMTAVHDKLGLTGTALEQTSTQALDLSRILGTDVTSTVSGVTKLFQAFSVPTKDMSADMDQLYTVSTHSGVALTDLTTAVSKVSAVAKPAGLSM
jgi:TP901 family phage tail tape measure protein